MTPASLGSPTSPPSRSSSCSSRSRSASPGGRRGARAPRSTSTPPAAASPGFQNGLALAGDYMSAASFLGIAGLVALSGFDGLIYSIGFLVGWPIVMFLIAEPLRNLGKYTFADVVAYRLRQTPVRIAAAIGTLAVVTLLPDRADGGRRQPDQAAVRPPLRVGGRDRGRGDAGLRAVRRHDRDHLGADRQGRAAAGRRVDPGRVMVLLALRHQPARALRRGGRAATARACWRPGSSWPIRWTRSRSASR